MKRWIVPVLLVLFVPFVVRGQVPDEKRLDAMVADAVKAFETPGAAVVVVHEDKVVYLKGTGVRELGSGEPMTADTIFQIASCTKAFLAMLIAMLIGDGHMDWEDPVRRHVPYFQLSDPLADQNVTVRDLLCHRTGLSRHDLLWFHSPLEPEEVIRRIGKVKLTTSFRSTWEYANIPFLTAGTAVSLREKKPLPDCFQERIFEPLGMRTASARAGDFLKATNRATGCRRGDKGKLELVTPLTYDLRGAGDISASARDLGQWLRFQLGDGTFEGKRLVPAKQFKETHAPQMVVKLTDAMKNGLYPDTNQLSYALGWFVLDYQGHALLTHGGSLPGFRTQTILVPKAKLGLVVLTNRNPSALPEALAKTIVDSYLNLPAKDWNAYFIKNDKKSAADRNKKEASINAKRVPDTNPSHELKAYLGTYENPAYGKAVLFEGKDGMTIRWNGLISPLNHWHYDTYRCHGEYVLDGEFLVVNFNAEGNVLNIHFLGQDFVRQKAAK